MPTFQVVGIDNRPLDQIEVDDGVFGAVINRSLVHRAVTMQRAGARQGTSATRGRGEVKGSGKKPWKQKHTGRARAGSSGSPIWRHGGIVFGPKPRNYGFNLQKKVYRAALRSALTSKVSSGDIVVVSDLSLSEAKTRHLNKVLTQLGLTGRTLMVVGAESLELKKASKNLANVKLIQVHELNVYDLLRYDKLVIVQSELMNVQEFWS